MSKFFMYGSELQELEQLMMLVPNFLPRRSGVIVVQRFRSEEGSTAFERDYERITAYCSSNASSGVTNKIAGGYINYEEIVCGCFEKCESHHLNVRLGDLIRSHDGELFLSPKHRSRFQTVCRIQNEAIENRSSAYLATLFLLTADDNLWCAAKDHIYRDSFDFKKMHLHGINTDGYAIYQMAKTIHCAKEYIKLNEISDKHLIGEQAFKGIINSILIAKYGAAMLQANC
ncbi:hypothetical protein [Acetobacterium sp. UBA5834]|uniref:hypothetical protein n=1 Tax=Acetobacterium sp. UBA5834 TaxID=1945907 RepID=UPI00257D0BF5|nr:hypothetical protein [Acetobacterium sp. UBA5834]